MEQFKVCSKCKRELSLDCFRWKNKSKGIRHSQCRDCQRESDKQLYLNNESRRITVRSIADNQRQRNLDIIEDVKKCGCCKCGDTRPFVLDFHHVDPSTKSYTIAHLSGAASVETLLSELNKCIIFCANCHREYHYLNKTFGITIDDYLKK